MSSINAADLEVARVHALARGVLKEVEDPLALAKPVPEDGDRAEVQRARAHPHQMADDPVELEVDDPQVLRAPGDLAVEQRLDGATEGHRVEVVGQVVHPLDDGDDLPVALVLGRLLDAGVDVADDRLEVAHDLALEGDEQPQDPVGGRVVGPEVQGQELLVDALPTLDAWRARRDVDGLLLAAVVGEVGHAV